MLILAVAAACVAALMWWKAPAAAQEATSPEASFVVRCDSSHRNSDDPIVYPGAPGAAHSHDFFGNSSTNAHSTHESLDRKSTRLNSSHANISYAVFCLKKKKKTNILSARR